MKIDKIKIFLSKQNVLTIIYILDKKNENYIYYKQISPSYFYSENNIVQLKHANTNITCQILNKTKTRNAVSQYLWTLKIKIQNNINITKNILFQLLKYKNIYVIGIFI